MNWSETPEWAAFCRRVVQFPHDHTARLVAADWLNDRDDATATARAELIRQQIDKPASLRLNRDEFASRGFPESALSGARGLLIEGGWPVWAVFEPHRFYKALVAPVFRFAPLTTCTTIGAAAQMVTRADDTIRFDFEEGPEDRADGAISDAAFGVLHSDGWSARQIAERGLNPHVVKYRSFGRLPGPVFRSLPFSATTGTWHRSEYRRVADANLQAHRAFWLCGRKWAELPRVYRGQKKPPAPHDIARRLFDVLSVATYQAVREGRALYFTLWESTSPFPSSEPRPMFPLACGSDHGSERVLNLSGCGDFIADVYGAEKQ